VHDNYHHFKFLKWKKQKEQEGKKWKWILRLNK
jgi:hypothetical protein